MSRLLPHRPEVEPETTDATVVDLTDDADAERIEVLATDTARAILSALHGDPATASEVAESVDTSLQNAHYHLTKLSDVGLVDVVETWYSSRGSEMPVYAPTIDQLVLTVGDDIGVDEQTDDDRSEEREAPTLVA
jgi:DNA-binding transcriptional ArsR family regulator